MTGILVRQITPERALVDPGPSRNLALAEADLIDQTTEISGSGLCLSVRPASRHPSLQAGGHSCLSLGDIAHSALMSTNKNKKIRHKYDIKRQHIEKAK